MADWADEVAYDLLGYPDEDGVFDFDLSGVAAALRTAKADGVMKAAYLAVPLGPLGRSSLWYELLTLADKVKRGME